MDPRAEGSPGSLPRMLSWPIPPYFQLLAPHADGASPACVVALDNGREIHAELLGIEADRDVLCLWMPGAARSHRLALEHVRSVRLLPPLRVVPDADAIRRLGAADPADAGERAFAITFTDGEVLRGTTRGFVKEMSGLFLFPVEGEPAQIQRIFVPGAQLAQVQIGPLLGETLQHGQQVDGAAIDEALDAQARLRTEKLGTQLIARGIVAPDELRLALDAQAQRPSAKVGQLLVDAGLLSDEQLREALTIQATNRERRLGDILVEMGVITARQVTHALAEKLGVPFVDVSAFPIEPAALGAVDAGFARTHQVLPLLRLNNALVVAVENPLAMDFAQELRFVSARNVVPVIADPRALRARIVQEYAAQTAAGADRDADTALDEVRVEELATALARERPQSTEARGADSEPRLSDNTLVRLVNKMILDARAEGASDIHIESNGGRGRTRIRFRRDGDLHDYLDLPPTFRSALVSRIKIMAGLDIAEHRHAQDGKIAFWRFGGAPIELRVAVIPTADNLEDVVLRLLGGLAPLPLDALGLGARDLEALRAMVTRSYGLILVCGPTGSGKTTTLHSVLREINRAEIKIWTAEDPVEIVQPGLRQVQINARIGWTFADAMRAFLRADPDVIMVGEMRDAETAKTGIEASLTGHLVFSTLHTNSAAESVVRLLDLGMDPFNFADALIGILSQRLVRRLCTHCRKPRRVPDDELRALAQDYCSGTELDPAQMIAQWQAAHDGAPVLYEAGGCAHCNAGYRGRVGIYELLRASPRVKELTRTRAAVPEIQRAAQHDGMHLLRQDALDKAFAGLVDLGSARAAAL